MDLLLVFVAALTFYWLTLAPAVIWGDSAELSVRAFDRWFEFGTAADHPLYVFVGAVFASLPGDVARNVNFAAAFFGALTVMLVYRCGRLLGASRLAACVGAAALCVSHAFWLHSVIAEVYSANAFFLTATLVLLLEWRMRDRWQWLAGAGLVFAIGLTNHLVLATAGPVAAVFVVMTKKRALFTRGSLAWVGVLAVALTIAAAGLLAHPTTGGALRRFWYGPPGIAEYLAIDVAPGPLAREIGYYLAYMTYQFPSVALPLGVVGMFALLRDRRPQGLLLLLTLAVNAAIFIKHTVWVGGAKYVFYIADYTIFSIFCAVGANEALHWIENKRKAQGKVLAMTLLTAVALMPPVFYALMPSLANRAGVDLVRARQLPYRNNNAFFLNPNKRGEHGAQRFGLDALHAARPGAVIFADPTPYTVLRYFQVVENLRPDVLVLTTRQPVQVRWLHGDRERPTYVAAMTPGYYDLSNLTGEYDLVPVGSIIEVRRRAAP
jgi:Protein of unknown function (DUF2723)